jgi:uncharacterized protein (DUF433 family)
MADLLSRITLDPNVRFGKPCIRGLRFAVGDVLSMLAAGMTVEQILDEHPDLEREDIMACLTYAARLERGQLRVAL